MDWTLEVVIVPVSDLDALDRLLPRPGRLRPRPRDRQRAHARRPADPARLGVLDRDREPADAERDGARLAARTPARGRRRRGRPRGAGLARRRVLARSRSSTSATAAPSSASPTPTATPGRCSSSRRVRRSPSSRTRRAVASARAWSPDRTDRTGLACNSPGWRVMLRPRSPRFPRTPGETAPPHTPSSRRSSPASYGAVVAAEDLDLLGHAPLRGVRRSGSSTSTAAGSVRPARIITAQSRSGSVTPSPRTTRRRPSAGHGRSRGHEHDRGGGVVDGASPPRRSGRRPARRPRRRGRRRGRPRRAPRAPRRGGAAPHRAPPPPPAGGRGSSSRPRDPLRGRR